VAVVEAMKMQNELTARHGGVVSEILVAERESVAAGQPLMRLVPEA
jgi:biotin carboxyl carrier protein